jgi:hypothetical protein
MISDLFSPNVGRSVSCLMCGGCGKVYEVGGVPVEPAVCIDCGGTGKVKIQGVPLEATL